MNESISNTISEIANKLGVSVENIIPYLTIYNIAERIAYIISAIVFFILIGLSSKLFLILLRSNDKDYNDSKITTYEHISNRDNISVFCSVLSGILLIAAIICLVYGLGIIKWIMGPEGATISYILDKIKS